MEKPEKKKQSYEMTRDEYFQDNYNFHKKVLGKIAQSYEEFQTREQDIGIIHKRHVEEALLDGNSDVSAEVLADYPDLAAKYLPIILKI